MESELIDPRWFIVVSVVVVAVVAALMWWVGNFTKR